MPDETQSSASSSQTLVRNAREIDERFESLEENLDSPVIAQWSQSRKRPMITLIDPKHVKYDLLFDDNDWTRLKKFTRHRFAEKKFVRELVLDILEPARKDGGVVSNRYTVEGILQGEPETHISKLHVQKVRDGAIYVKRELGPVGTLRFDIRNDRIQRVAVSLDGEKNVIRLNSDGSVDWRRQKRRGLVYAFSAFVVISTLAALIFALKHLL